VYEIRTKSFYFNESKCTSIHEIDQGTPDSATSHVKEPERNVSVKNKFHSKIKKRKWDHD